MCVPIGSGVQDKTNRVGVVGRVTSGHRITGDYECWAYSWTTLVKTSGLSTYLGVKRDKIQFCLPKEFVSNDDI